MKTKSQVLICLLIILSSTMYGNSMKKETRSTEPFKAVSASGSIDVVYIESADYKLVVEAKEEFAKLVETTVKNGVLAIKFNTKGPNIAQRDEADDIVVYISAPTLNQVSMSGSGDFKAERLNNKEDVSFHSSGSSDIEVTNLQAANVSFFTAGSSDIDVKQLTAQKCNISSNGSSDFEIRLNVSEINTKASGSSDLNLIGKTDKILIASSGSSIIDISQLKYNSISEAIQGDSNIKK